MMKFIGGLVVGVVIGASVVAAADSVGFHTVVDLGRIQETETCGEYYASGYVAGVFDALAYNSPEAVGITLKEIWEESLKVMWDRPELRTQSAARSIALALARKGVVIGRQRCPEIEIQDR